MVSNSRKLKYSDPKYYFKLQKVPSKFIGFWPGDENLTIFKLSLTIFHAVFILVAVAFEFNFAYINADNLGFVMLV